MKNPTETLFKRRTGTPPVEGPVPPTFIEIPGLRVRLGEGFHSFSSAASGNICVPLTEVVGLKREADPSRPPRDLRSREGIQIDPEGPSTGAEFVLNSLRLLAYAPVQETFNELTTRRPNRKVFVENVSYEGEVFQNKKSTKLNQTDCGDRFIYQIKTGASLAMILFLDFTGAEEKVAFEREFGNEAPFGSPLGNQDRRLVKFLAGKAEFRLKILQMGGDAVATAKTIADSGCRGVDLLACRQTMFHLRAQFETSLAAPSIALSPWKVFEFSVRGYGTD